MERKTTTKIHKWGVNETTKWGFLVGHSWPQSFIFDISDKKELGGISFSLFRFLPENVILRVALQWYYLCQVQSREGMLI